MFILDFLATRPDLQGVVVHRPLLWNSEVGSSSQNITTLSAIHHCKVPGIGDGYFLKINKAKL
ncbi:hypothetical protein DPMN_132571 [Dreissena polymorpha]|uniref:Uncharacterized protein n=1 Tax=Dreissena polymorpha TaxID=45954 RepID=A0A9D4FYL3_DREPO|nr:hypothetical protein DPMN_132571 [Dreissena polymorpha]